MKRVTGTRILGLALVPLVVVGMFLWGLWDPVSRLEHVTAAVVNLDEPVEVDGQLTPLGRVLAAELVGGEADGNFTWVLTDEDHGEEGLSNGEFVTVVTIPESFSAAATSFAEGPDSVRQATIMIEHSDQGKLLDQALSSIVTGAATRIVNEQLGSAFVGNVFVGMRELSDGMTEAADGAEQLADGSEQLANGLDEFSTGTRQLVQGTTELADGASQYAAGARDAANGSQQFAAGVREFASGASELSAGARLLADGTAELADGVDAYTGSFNSLLEPVSEGIKEQVPRLQELRTQIVEGTIPLPEDLQQEILAAIDGLIGAPALLDEAIDGGVALSAGAREAADGVEGIASGIDELTAGADGLAAGASELADGVNALADGADGLASGAWQLAGGVPSLADGADELADGARMSADGTAELADGLGTVADEIPSYTDDESETLAQVAVQPVASDRLSAELFANSGAPLFSSIALWIGALASFLLLTPLTARAADAARSEARLALRSSLPALGLGSLQGALVGLLVTVSLRPSASVGVALFAVAVVAGIAFSLLNQGLIALFKGVGRFISLIILAAAFAAGIVSTSPGVLKTVGDLSPIGTTVSGLQHVLSGGSAAGTIVALVAWGALGFVLIGAAVHRTRVRHIHSLG